MVSIVRKSALLLFLFGLNSCDHQAKWDKRREKQAKHQCECIESWQKSVPGRVLEFYKDVDELAFPKASRREPAEIRDEVEALKATLSKNDLKWNTRFGKAVRNKNSSLYKCYYKQFDWSDESPGNSYYYKGPSDEELGCPLSEYFGFFSNWDNFADLVFD